MFASTHTPARSLTVTVQSSFSFRDLHAPHKVTYRHQSGIISYVILRAPSKDVMAIVDPEKALPILLNLHGAGLEANDHQVRHMLDPLPDLRAFVLFPTGVTPWSGDDWHDWGFADVKAAIASIPDWIAQVEWQGPREDPDRWLVSGHSNGGQGTLYALTHYPDRIIGAAAVSGYLSIQKYVPYHSWIEADSRISQNIESALQSFRHELLVDNFGNVPILLQHGSNDDNVPTFHSRRLHQLISQSRQNQSSYYVEQTGKGHWYDGVMTTPPLKTFYDHCLGSEAGTCEPPRQYQIVVANPADTESCGGLQVDQLLVPDQLGKINVKCDAGSNTVYLETSNVRRFHFTVGRSLIKAPFGLVVDGHRLPEVRQLDTCPESRESNLWLLFEDCTWKVSNFLPHSSAFR